MVRRNGVVDKVLMGLACVVSGSVNVLALIGQSRRQRETVATRSCSVLGDPMQSLKANRVSGRMNNASVARCFGFECDTAVSICTVRDGRIKI